MMAESIQSVSIERLNERGEKFAVEVNDQFLDGKALDVIMEHNGLTYGGKIILEVVFSDHKFVIEDTEKPVPEASA